MSRGLGHVQRTILAMIEADPHGAWTVEEICRRAYPGAKVEKRHRVAVLRAFKRSGILPGAWTVKHLWPWGNVVALLDPYDDDSQARAAYSVRHPSAAGYDFDRWKAGRAGRPGYDDALEAAAEAREYRDASPVKKIEIETERLRTIIGLLSMGGTASGAAAAREYAAMIAEMTIERARLLAAAPVEARSVRAAA
jgi:hypothetical protein